MTMQINHYYPFGNTFGEYNHCDENPGLQRYKFNGKELDLVHGLRLYDYGARMYDNLLGCWTSVDPMAEKYYYVSPYVFCADNPVSLVDDNGERPSAYEAALMASAVYNDKIGKKNQKLLEKANWVQSKIKTSIKKNYTKFFENGLQSEIFERTIDGKTEYAYVYAGTNSVEDGLEDIAQVFGVAPQYYTAIENARILSSELGEKELTFVGHSLGGGEAAAASMATGRAAITFNPASVSIITKFFANLGNASKVTNYRTLGVTWKKLNFGGDPVNNIQDNLGLKASGLTIPIPIGIDNPLSSHSIETIINYLKRHQ